ncbi:hypothetical protein KJ633_04415 [bacterium]|nr:hypothetical protein [bacterium]MBU3955684.1 hypothetical protein [bacterium]
MKKIFFISVMTLLFLPRVIAAAVESAPRHGGAASKSRMDAGRLEKLADRIKSVKKSAPRSAMPGKNIEVTEEELTKYIMERAARKNGRASLYSLKINFLQNNIFDITAAIDFDLSGFFETEKRLLIAKILGKSKGIKNTIYLKVQVASAKGKGILIVNTIKINGIKLPDGLVRESLIKIGKKQNPPVDPGMLTRLPYGIQKIEILPGKIRLRM